MNYLKNINIKKLLIVFILILIPLNQSNASYDRDYIINLIIKLINERGVQQSSIYYDVSQVIDGDTVDIIINGKKTRVRLIGIDTPELNDSRQEVRCLAQKASEELKKLINGKKVRLEFDATQGNKDKYDRILRYLYLENGISINQYMIKEGYAYEYTYSTPYKYQSDYKESQQEAKNSKKGLWSNDACVGNKELGDLCNIKGNINSKGEKIYHLSECPSYQDTIINTNSGEKWFCSEQEAISFGWRKAINCP